MSLVFNQVYLLTNPALPREESFHLIALGPRTRIDDYGSMLQVLTNDGIGSHGFRVRETLRDEIQTGVVELRDEHDIVWRFEPLTVEAFRRLEGYPESLRRYEEDEDLRSYFREQLLQDWWTET